jgi:hypothetical protein
MTTGTTMTKHTNEDLTPKDGQCWGNWCGNLLKAIDQIYDLRRYVYGGKQPSDQAAMQEALDRLRGTR